MKLNIPENSFPEVRVLWMVLSMAADVRPQVTEVPSVPIDQDYSPAACRFDGQSPGPATCLANEQHNPMRSPSGESLQVRLAFTPNNDAAAAVVDAVGVLLNAQAGALSHRIG
eukprot:COSAG05_NODE_2815_length_2610_cov_1.418957_3_plen_113_part_00